MRFTIKVFSHGLGDTPTEYYIVDQSNRPVLRDGGILLYEDKQLATDKCNELNGGIYAKMDKGRVRRMETKSL